MTGHIVDFVSTLIFIAAVMVIGGLLTGAI